MMDPSADVVPAFVEMAHRIVCCTVPTTGADGATTHTCAAPALGMGRGGPDPVDRDVPEVAERRRDRLGACRVIDVLVGEPTTRAGGL